MARKDALLRLHQRLAAKRDGIRRKLAEEQGVAWLGSSGGDVGDLAHEMEQNELNSQLASLESRELRQIERAMELIREGRYGRCDHCNRSIPIARLQALPFTLLCVECQREQEASGLTGDPFEIDWESAIEYEGRSSEREISISDIELDY